MRHQWKEHWIESQKMYPGPFVSQCGFLLFIIKYYIVKYVYYFGLEI